MDIRVLRLLFLPKTLAVRLIRTFAQPRVKNQRMLLAAAFLAGLLLPNAAAAQSWLLRECQRPSEQAVLLTEMRLKRMRPQGDGR